MHSYSHNIKTFNNATMHLTRVERSLYRDLTELYYDNEQPLPAIDFNKLARRVRAHTNEEKEALQYVLGEFFEKTGDVYSHDYCDDQIDSYHNMKTAKAKAGKASAESRKKKAALRKAKRTSVNKQKTTGVEHVLNNTETLVHNQEPRTKNHSIKRIDQSTIDQERNDYFEVFWLSGIRKVNKKKAKSLFINIIKKQKDLEQFIQMLTNDIQKRIDSNQLGFTEMHPTTYLNGERWNDEIITTNGSQNSGRKLSVVESVNQATDEWAERQKRSCGEKVLEGNG